MAMQSIAVLLLLALFAPAARGREIVVGDSDKKKYPVSKVIALLKDMQAQLEKEGEEDEEVYDKMMCWCKTNRKDKVQSVKDAEARIADLQTTIETSAARIGQLKGEIGAEGGDLDKGQKSLDDLEALRKKQYEEFLDEEKEMIESIKALEAALIVLEKHQGENIKAQASTYASMAQVGKVLKTEMNKHRDLLLGVITPRQRHIAMGLVQEDQPRFRTYQGQSGEIYGILEQMLETFKGNLADSRKADADAQKAFEGQKGAKEAELAAIEESLNEKQKQLAKASELNAQSKEDLEDTQDSLTVDEDFQRMLEAKCAQVEKEWQERQRTRQEELAAINEAIVILSGDEAHDTFSRTFNPAASFTQKAMRRVVAHSRAAHEAAKVLKEAASKAHSGKMELLALAETIKASSGIDAFTQVKKAIDEMVTELQKQTAEEVQQKDMCVKQENENALMEEKKQREKADLESQITTLTQAITDTEAALKTLEKEIAELQTQIRRAGEDREAENKDFQSTIADQRETQKLLQKAIAVLSRVYVKTEVTKTDTGLIQKQKQQPPPPPGFKAYSKNAAGGGAVGLLQKILSDAKVMEAEAVKDEQASQESYESFVRSTNDSVNSKQKAIINKSEALGKAKTDKNNAENELKQVETELLALDNARADLKLECDFLLRNFDLRQKARDEEIEALQQAKAILSGMQLQ